MWRKIHSNRDPRDTLYSELRKEFRTYFDRAGGFAKAHLKARPKFFFGLMVSLLLASIISVFALSRRQIPVAPVQKSVVSPVADGFSQIMQATAKIRETLRLKHLVDSFSAKKHLSRSDSTTLDSTLSRLQQIHSPIK